MFLLSSDSPSPSRTIQNRTSKPGHNRRRNLWGSRGEIPGQRDSRCSGAKTRSRRGGWGLQGSRGSFGGGVKRASPAASPVDTTCTSRYNHQKWRTPCGAFCWYFLFFFKKFIYFICLFLAALGLCCCARASHCSGFSCCRARALGARLQVLWLAGSRAQAQ